MQPRGGGREEGRTSIRPRISFPPIQLVWPSFLTRLCFSFADAPGIVTARRPDRTVKRELLERFSNGISPRVLLPEIRIPVRVIDISSRTVYVTAILR